MKSGIDYFPLDVTLDSKFELVEAEFGLTGFAVVVKLFQRIFGGEGYYCEWTNEVALLFSKNVGLGGNAVSEILSAAIKRGIFDSNLYDKYGILTSRGIQKRYFEAVNRRKEITVKRQYLLVECDQICKNVNIRAENVDNQVKNDYIPKQSKVKESRVKESKEESSPHTPPEKNPGRRKYGQYGWVKLTEEEYQNLLKDLGENEVKRCIYYIDESAQSSGNKNNWKDWNLVIRRCSRDGWGKGKGVSSLPKQQSEVSGRFNYDEFEKRSMELMKGKMRRK